VARKHKSPSDPPLSNDRVCFRRVISSVRFSHRARIRTDARVQYKLSNLEFEAGRRRLHSCTRLL